MYHITSFLLPPSCMVAPIGNIANKFLFSTLSSSTTSKQQALALPTMSPSNHTGIDISTRQVLANNCEVRERTPITALNLSRESSMTSFGQATPYYDRIDDKMDYESTSRDVAPELSYETE